MAIVSIIIISLVITGLCYVQTKNTRRDNDYRLRRGARLNFN